jgi:hypothetical protein
MQKVHYPSLCELLQLLSDEASMRQEMSLEEVFAILAKRGYAALMLLFSLPFCLPVQLPGLSTPFGMMLCFLGLRLAFGHRPWWPRWVLKKQLPAARIAELAEKAILLIRRAKKLVHPRLEGVVHNPVMQRLHGVVIFFLALFLALPLPIPFTNLLTAVPISLISLGLLEDDGLLVLIGYAIAAVGLTAFAIISTVIVQHVEAYTLTLVLF